MKTRLKKITVMFLAAVMVVTLVPGKLCVRGADEERYSIVLENQYAKVGDRLTVRPTLYHADSDGYFSEIEIDESLYSFSWSKGIWSEEKGEYVYGDALSTDADFVIDSVKETDYYTVENNVAFRCIVSKDGKEIANGAFIINSWEKGYYVEVNPVFANEGDTVTFTAEIYDQNHEKVSENDAYWEKHELVWSKRINDRNDSWNVQVEELGKGKLCSVVVEAKDMYNLDNNIITEYFCRIKEGDVAVSTCSFYVYKKGESFNTETTTYTAKVGDKLTLTANIYDMETGKRINPSECGLEIKWKKTSYILSSSSWETQVVSLGMGETCEIASVTEDDFSPSISYSYEFYKDGKRLGYGYVALTNREVQQPPESTSEEGSTKPSEETTTPQSTEETTKTLPEETTTGKLQETDTQQTTVPTSRTDKDGVSIPTPGKVKKFKVKKQKSRKLKLTWKKMKKVSGYQIFYTTDKKFKKGVKKVRVKASAKGITISKLKKKKIYYIKMRAYNKAGKRIKYGAWTKPKKVKINK